jgi:mannose-1-phosphate guanylyltransferase
MNHNGESIRCAIILAGGDGERLRPFVEELQSKYLPKQYVNFVGKRSMLEHTYDRARKLLARENIFTVARKVHLLLPEARGQLGKLPQHRVILQPQNKDTLPAILLALMAVQKKHPNANVIVFPADHFVLEEDLFMAYVTSAFNYIEREPEQMVLLGRIPDFQDSEYDYVLPKEDPKFSEIVTAKRFAERAGRVSAYWLVQRGALWNTSILAANVNTLLRAVRELAPDLHQSFQKIKPYLGTPSERRCMVELYVGMEPRNFLKDFLELLPPYDSSILKVLPFDEVLWSDWDAQERVMRVTMKTGDLRRLNRTTHNPESEFLNKDRPKVSVNR